MLIAATFVPPLPFPTRAVAVPAFFTASPAPLPPGTTVLVVPFSHDFYSTQAVLWQARGGDVVLHARGLRHQPPAVGRRRPGAAAERHRVDAGGDRGGDGAGDAAVSDAVRALAILAELRGWHVERGGARADRPARRRAAGVPRDLLGAQPVDRDGVALWRAVPAPS